MSWFGTWDGFDDEMQKAPNIFTRKPITNGDRIRAMTDEELAEYLDINYPLYYTDWLNWLKQEVKDNE